MCDVDDTDCWIDQLQTVVVLRTEFDSLRLEFLISIIIVSIVLFLSLVLLIILYAWMYAVEKKMQKVTGTSTVDFKIRRAKIREFPSSNSPISTNLPASPKPPVNGQNPLARGSPNFTAVVDDLNKRSSNQPNSQQPRYPNYINDNNNFIY
ncbi:hypothetical protein Trydic_g21378 [Trypoxylus dichotomus]